MGLRTAMSGPPPKAADERRRRNKVPGAVQLPAAGRQGPIPDFPLGPDLNTWAKLEVAQNELEALQCASDEGEQVGGKLRRAAERVAVLEKVVEGQADAERALWAKLWATPQAVEWESLGWLDEVALYTRWQVLAANGDLNCGREARQYSDRLGLTPLAMLRLRWEVTDSAHLHAVPTPSGEASTRTSRRSRLSSA